MASLRLRVDRRPGMHWLKEHVFTKENLWALALCLLIALLVIFSADRTPLWIYQGF